MVWCALVSDGPVLDHPQTLVDPADPTPRAVDGGGGASHDEVTTGSRLQFDRLGLAVEGGCRQWVKLGL